MKKVAIASDHAGFHLKSAIIDQFKETYDWVDLGTNSTESVDYPDFGHKVVVNQLADSRSNKIKCYRYSHALRLSLREHQLTVNIHVLT